MSAEQEAERIVGLATARFTILTGAEVQFLRALPKGEIAVCGTDMNDAGALNDPARGDRWPSERRISGELIRWVCVTREIRDLIDPTGVQIYGALIEEEIDLSFAKLPFPVRFDHCRLLRRLVLRGTEIQELAMNGTWVSSISGDGAVVKDDIFFWAGFYAQHGVRFVGAKIGGDIDCTGGRFSRHSKEEPYALAFDRCVVGGNVHLRGGFIAHGETRFCNAQVSGDFKCGAAILRNPPIRREPGEECFDTALNAKGISIRGDAVFKARTAVKGKIDLSGCRIEGKLDCADAVFVNRPKDGVIDSRQVLDAKYAVVRGNVFLNHDLSVEGNVRLAGAQVTGQLVCAPKRFAGDLDAHNAVIGGSLTLYGAREAGSSVNLSNASTSALHDERESWPSRGNLNLDGFAYQRISSGPKDAKSRLDWIERQEKFSSQPYRRLAEVLRREGDDAGATYVLYRMEKKRRGLDNGSLLAKLQSGGFWLTTGYGYYPIVSLLWLLVLILAGSVLYQGGYAKGVMAPTEKEAYVEFTNGRPLPGHYEKFYPMLYSLETSVQIIKLGEADRWQPDPGRQSCVSALTWMCFPDARTPAGFLQVFRWLQIFLGWFLATMGIGAVTGILRKD